MIDFFHKELHFVELGAIYMTMSIDTFMFINTPLVDQKAQTWYFDMQNINYHS